MPHQSISAPITFQEIAGFPHYRVGDDGSVWSRKVRGSNGKSTGDWWKLKLTLQNTGYLHVTLCNGGKKGRQFAVHRLVLEAFVGKCPKGMQCLHADGVRSNNALGNIKWGTPTENQNDRLRHGTDSCGTKSKTAKLTEAVVSEIRSLRAAHGTSTSSLARRFEVSRRCIDFAINRQTWKHVL